MDEFDALWDADTAVDPFDQAWETTAPEMSTSEKVVTGILTAGNSALLGFGDEIGAAGAAAIDEGKELFGLAPEADFGDRYTGYRDTAREKLGQFREENPKTAFGLDVAGGLATGGVGAAKTGVLQTPSLLGKVARGAATGTVVGGVAGAGYADGELKDRILGATQGAGLGAVFGAGVGGVSGVVSKIGRSGTAFKLKQRFSEMAKEELGAIGSLKGKPPEQITNAQKAVLKIFEDATDDEILLAAERIESAHKTGTPITLFEALDVPQGYIDAKQVRATRGGRNVAERFLQDRRKGTAARIGAVLDDISPEDDVYIGSRAVGDAASEIVKRTEAGRSVLASPMYKIASERTPIIESSQIDQVLELPRVQAIIKEIRTDFPEMAALRDNHVSILDKVKQGLDDQISDALSGNKPKKHLAASLGEWKKKLTDGIDYYNDDYKFAREVYKGMSSPVNWLKGNKWGDKKTVGLLEDLLGANAEKAGSAARLLINKSPKQLEKIAAVFETSGKTAELRAGFRAALQDKLDRVGTGVLDDKGGSIVDRIFGQNNTKEKLRIILGDDELGKLWNKVDLEGLVAKGESEIGISARAMGSPTQQLQRAAGEHKGILGKILTQSPTATLKDIFANLKPSEHEQLTKEIAEELFSTPDPKKFKQLANLQLQYNKYVRGVDPKIAVAQGGVTQAGITSGNSESGKVAPELVLGVGSAGAATAAASAPWGTTDSAEGAEDEGEEALTQTNILWKPASDADGKLVVLFPYETGNLVIKDAETGKVLDTGRSTGASNGYADTVRFNKPGSSFKNVVIEDGKGNLLYVDDGARRDENLATKKNAPKSKQKRGGALSEQPEAGLGYLSRMSAEGRTGALSRREGDVVQASNRGKELIKKFEGKRNEPYKDTGGVVTVGYGHTGDSAKSGKKLTDDEIEGLLDEDMQTATSAVERLVDVELSQNQIDALTSFVFNVGEGAFAKSTMLRKINDGDFEGAEKEFMKWVYDDGRKLRGLERRRRQEAELFAQT